jgi:hypothetical protein
MPVLTGGFGRRSAVRSAPVDHAGLMAARSDGVTSASWLELAMALQMDTFK